MNRHINLVTIDTANLNTTLTRQRDLEITQNDKFDTRIHKNDYKKKLIKNTEKKVMQIYKII